MQFISIARLGDTSNRPHEVSDDLELLFWVLLSQVAECRDAMGIHLVDEMTLRGVFDPHTDMPVNPTVPYQAQASGSTDLGGRGV
jgi:hypothetical protein